MEDYDSSSSNEDITFTYEDYINNPEACQILEENFHRSFEKNMLEKIEDFYKSKVQDCVENIMDVFDKDYFGEKSYEFYLLIYEYITKNYDISIFKDDPDLANSLFKKPEENVKTEKTAPKIISSKKYDWATKSHK
tara:strand:- start:141 stop:548 length:408 start_codon:yes stop_codon:yes gene_type:complete